MRPADAIPDAPVYRATMAEMENLEELFATANQLAMQYGAVRIDPPEAWTHPPLRMNQKSRFFVRLQTLPASPFADSELVRRSATAKQQPRKRTRHKPPLISDDESDTAVPDQKDSATARRHRAARAASRSQRSQQQVPSHSDQALPSHTGKGEPASSAREQINFQKMQHKITHIPVTPVPSDDAVPLPKVKVPQNDEHIPIPRKPPQTLPPPLAPLKQQNWSSKGPSAAVREAAPRSADAFPGFAKASSARNAPAILLCPFSQQTAREHMAKRSATEKPRPLAAQTFRVPHHSSAAQTEGRPLQENEFRTSSASGGRQPEKSLRSDEAALGCRNNEDQSSGNGNAENRLAAYGIRDARLTAQPYQQDAKYQRREGYEKVEGMTSNTGTYAIHSTGVKKGMYCKSAPIPHSLAAKPNHVIPGPQPTPFPRIQGHMKPQSPLPAPTKTPFCKTKDRAGYVKDRPDYFPRTTALNTSIAPHLGPVPAPLSSDAKTHEKGKEAMYFSLPVMSTSERIPELQRIPRRQLGNGSHVEFGNLPPISRGLDKDQGQTFRNTNSIPSPPILFPRNNATAQERNATPHHEMSSTAKVRDGTPLQARPQKPNYLNAGEGRSLRPEIFPHYIEEQAEDKKVSLLRRRDEGEENERQHVPDATGMGPCASVTAKCKGEPEDTRCVNQSNQEKPRVDKGVHEKPLGKSDLMPPDSNPRPKSHLDLSCDNTQGRSIPHLANGGAMLILQGPCGKNDTPPRDVSYPLSGTQEDSNDLHPQQQRLSLAEYGMNVQKGVTGISNMNAGSIALHSGPSSAPSTQEKGSNITAKELVEEIFAAATRSGEFLSTKPNFPEVVQVQRKTTQHSARRGRTMDSGISVVEIPYQVKGAVTAQPEKNSMGCKTETNTDAKLEDRPTSLRRQKLDLAIQAKIHIPEKSGNAKDEERPAVSLRERESRKRSKPEPITYVDTDLPIIENKASASATKPLAKRTPKPKGESRCLRFDQDEAGRLTKAIVFPDSSNPISLASYKKKAQQHHQKTSLALNSSQQHGTDTIMLEQGNANLNLHDVDTLETEFWKAMAGGIRGEPITVAYGVDVEAEGAFNNNAMSYIEWHEANPMKTPTKRNRGPPRKPKGGKSGPTSLEVNAKVPRKHMKLPLGPNPEGIHNKADDEIEHAGEALVVKPSTREQQAFVGKEKQSPRPAKRQRTNASGLRNNVGTLNRDGLLRHLPRMPGINHSMYYVGQLFTRFCWHTEDAFLNSVSYLHLGSAEKVWYAVPPCHAVAFEKFASSKVFSPDLLESENTGQLMLMNKTTMFDPRSVRRKGVRIYRVVHRPGSFVLTAPRAYHAGFNCGFNIAEAVNFASPTWFPVGRVASSFARKVSKPLCVPWEYLLFHEAKAMRDISRGAIERKISANRLVANAKVVAQELKLTIMEGEQKIWKYAEARNCRVSMLHDIDALAKNNQVGPEFGSGAGMVCSLCTHTCHFYAEMCGSCDDSFEARCVDHFGEGHRLCLHKDHKTVIVRRHDPVLLLDILGYLEKVAHIEVDESEQAQRYIGYLRPWQTPLKSSGLRLRLDLKAATSRKPPRVSKEKAPRQKPGRATGSREKMDRATRRKIRKPHGMFGSTEVGKKHGMFSQLQALADSELISSAKDQHTDGMDERPKSNEIGEGKGKAPMLQY